MTPKQKPFRGLPIAHVSPWHDAAAVCQLLVGASAIVLFGFMFPTPATSPSTPHGQTQLMTRRVRPSRRSTSCSTSAGVISGSQASHVLPVPGPAHVRSGTAMGRIPAAILRRTTAATSAGCRRSGTQRLRSGARVPLFLLSTDRPKAGARPALPVSRGGCGAVGEPIYRPPGLRRTTGRSW
jgi:hypothetical protein